MEGITDDLLDIAGRLYEIDPQYQLYRNNELDRFELWWCDKFNLIIPYDRLDERTVNLVLTTRRENADEISKKIDEQNEELERQRQKNIAIMQAKLKDRILYEGGKI